MTPSKCTSLRAIFRYSIATILGAAAAVLVTPLTCHSPPRMTDTPIPNTIEQSDAERNAPNPLPPFPSLHLKDLTWLEVRDKIQAGYKRVIIPTGGIEQNGPFVALNKHDLIVEEVSKRAAVLTPGTLVAPVVSFVPEGELSPPSGHMRYPGTISVREETFVRLLTDIASSLAIHGFTDIVLLGDSGDSQEGLNAAASQLQALRSSGTSVRFVREFYNYDSVREFLRKRGIVEQQMPFHEELAFSLQLLAINPSAIRYDERITAGHPNLGGVSLLSKDKLIALGEEILNSRARTLADLIQQK